MEISKVLIGHVSPATAFVVDDYPYGFTLRCRIRYWLEIHPSRGARLCTQTTNPKRAGAEFWNKPKKSTYCRIGACLYLDEKGHVQWSGLTEYSDSIETARWLDKFAAGNVLPEVARKWLKAKVIYERTMEKDRTADEVWNRTHKDYRSVVDGKRHVLRYEEGKGTVLVPIE